MAISSYKVFLMGLFAPSTGTTGVWQKLVDIKDFPDLIEPPEQLETTTLSNKNRTYIPGIQDASEKTFTCNYTKADFDRLAALQGTLYGYAVWFGGTEADSVVTPTGSDGKFSFAGYITPSVSGAGVNEVVNMTITITPATDITTDGDVDWGAYTETLIPTT